MRKFNSLLEAEAAWKKAIDEKDDKLCAQAFVYIYQNCPPDLKKLIDEKAREYCPEIVPDYYDDNGTPYYSISAIAKATGQTEEKVAAVLKEAGVPADAYKFDSGNLHKVQ